MPQGAPSLNDSSCPPGHNHSDSIKNERPVSFKRLLDGNASHLDRRAPGNGLAQRRGRLVSVGRDIVANELGNCKERLLIREPKKEIPISYRYTVQGLGHGGESTSCLETEPAVMTAREKAAAVSSKQPCERLCELQIRFAALKAVARFQPADRQ